MADVTTSSGQIFRTTLKQPPFMSHLVRLAVGEVVDVLADGKAQHAKFDRSDPRVTGNPDPSGRDGFKQALNQAPGTPPPGSSPSRVTE